MWGAVMTQGPVVGKPPFQKRFEGDARAIVPVRDDIGGTVIYLNGRPAYYVLHGEWFEAVSGTAVAPSTAKPEDPVVEVDAEVEDEQGTRRESIDFPG